MGFLPNRESMSEYIVKASTAVGACTGSGYYTLLPIAGGDYSLIKAFNIRAEVMTSPASFAIVGS